MIELLHFKISTVPTFALSVKIWVGCLLFSFFGYKNKLFTQPGHIYHISVEIIRLLFLLLKFSAPMQKITTHVSKFCRILGWWCHKCQNYFQLLCLVPICVLVYGFKNIIINHTSIGVLPIQLWWCTVCVQWFCAYIWVYINIYIFPQKE